MFEINEEDSIQEKRRKETQRKILEILTTIEDECATVKQLTDALESSGSTLRPHLEYLRGAKLIKKKGTLYFITELGKKQISNKQ